MSAHHPFDSNSNNNGSAAAAADEQQNVDDVPLHQQFLQELRAEGRNEMSGPFGDKSGGAYLLRAVDLAEAQAIARRDPAHTSGGWEISVREWLAH